MKYLLILLTLLLTSCGGEIKDETPRKYGIGEQCLTNCLELEGYSEHFYGQYELEALDPPFWYCKCMTDTKEVKILLMEPLIEE